MLKLDNVPTLKQGRSTEKALLGRFDEKVPYKVLKIMAAEKEMPCIRVRG